jgi:hypothetical protein
MSAVDRPVRSRARWAKGEHKGRTIHLLLVDLLRGVEV